MTRHGRATKSARQMGMAGPVALWGVSPSTIAAVHCLGLRSGCLQTRIPKAAAERTRAGWAGARLCIVHRVAKRTTIIIQKGRPKITMNDPCDSRNSRSAHAAYRDNRPEHVVVQQHLMVPSLTPRGDQSDLIPPALGFLVAGMADVSLGEVSEMTYASLNFDAVSCATRRQNLFFCSETQFTSYFRNSELIDVRGGFAYSAFRSTPMPR